jgi:methylase of polypeptide subunit release factors
VKQEALLSRKGSSSQLKRRILGEHLTPVKIFKNFILPEIKNNLYDYIWVDLFCGEGNLILPILELIPEKERIDFFKKHIYMFDIQPELVKKAINNAKQYGIPFEIAKENILVRDTIQNYPDFILTNDLPVYHITNPPYLYIGHIAKHKATKEYLEYFKGENEGYQDLYQLALMNDLRHGIEKMIYIIPSNFLFGFSVSNKIRMDFFYWYTITKAYIFEKKVFEHTGTNVIISFFERKKSLDRKPIIFKGVKINNTIKERTYVLKPENKYRAGNEFEEFVNNYKTSKPLRVIFYLTMEEVKQNQGDKEIWVIDANSFNGKTYEKKKIFVNEKLFQKIKSNVLFVRTVDTGSLEGRAGLYVIRDAFGVDGILVSKDKYRTHPIQVFLEPSLSIKAQLLLKDYFNLILEYFREITDSEFMTTYKYSNSKYTRKYLGLKQVKALIETFPLLELNEDERKKLANLVVYKNVEELVSFIKNRRSR